jgi:hypothetical protein
LINGYSYEGSESQKKTYQLPNRFNQPQASTHQDVDAGEIPGQHAFLISSLGKRAPYCLARTLSSTLNANLRNHGSTLLRRKVATIGFCSRIDAPTDSSIGMYSYLRKLLLRNFRQIESKELARDDAWEGLSQQLITRVTLDSALCPNSIFINA